MFFYRTDLLEKYGVEPPPVTGWSFDEMRRTRSRSRMQINAEGLADTYALVLGAKPQFHSAINIVQPAWAMAAEFFDADFNPNFTSEQMTNATTFMTNLLFQDKVMSPGVVGYEYPEVLTAFQQGKAVDGAGVERGRADDLESDRFADHRGNDRVHSLSV